MQQQQNDINPAVVVGEVREWAFIIWSKRSNKKRKMAFMFSYMFN
jgi:hypothetical protein